MIAVAHAEPPAEILDQSVDALEFSTRASGVFANMGVATIRDLVRLTPLDLLLAPNFGQRTLREVETALEVVGLSLGQKVAPSSEIEPPAKAKARPPRARPKTVEELSDRMILVNIREGLRPDQVGYLSIEDIRLIGLLAKVPNQSFVADLLNQKRGDVKRSIGDILISFRRSAEEVRLDTSYVRSMDALQATFLRSGIDPLSVGQPMAIDAGRIKELEDEVERLHAKIKAMVKAVQREAACVE